MAARRLIAILLVMLFLSSLAAALAPVPEGVNEEGSTTDSATSSALAQEGPSGEAQLIRQGIHAAQDRPVVIRADLGDQLQLRVTSESPGTVELVGLGPTEDVGPDQPALFDVLLDGDGTFPVRFLGGEEREIARIEVR